MRLAKDNILRCDNKKIIGLWSAKSGCATFTQMFFEYIGFSYDSSKFIHEERIRYVAEHHSSFPLFIDNELVNTDHKDYITMQLVRNPYDRAVSSYLVSTTRDSEYYRTIDYPNIIAELPNNLSFIEFLEMIKYQIFNSANLDIHYEVQTMEHSYVALLQNNIIKLENFQQDIINFNLRHSTNFNQFIHYDIHSHKHPLSAYQFYHKKPPESYDVYYKDSLAKKLVDSIYGYDIYNFKYTFNY
jgi:hypothetical protein